MADTLDPDRGLMAAVAPVIDLLDRDTRDWPTLGRYLSGASSVQLVPLTREVFGGGQVAARFGATDDEANCLTTLVDQGIQLHVTPAEVNFEARLRRVLNLHPISATGFALAGLKGHGPFSRIALEASAKLVPEDSILEIAVSNPNRLRGAIEAFGSRLERIDLWRGQPAIAQVLIDTVLTDGEGDIAIRVAAAASIALEDEVAWSRLFGELGSRFVLATAELASQADSVLLPPAAWKAIVYERHAVLAEVDRAGSNPEFLRQFARNLDPREDSLHRLGLHVWQPLADDPVWPTSPDLWTPVFLVILGLLESQDSISASLVKAGFASVYWAAAIENLPSDMTSVLTSVLPTLGFRQDWDICGRLRRAVLNQVKSSRWTIQSVSPLFSVGTVAEWDGSIQWVKPKRLREELRRVLHSTVR